MSKKAIIISSDADWEGLFVDGVLVEEGHTLNEGTERVLYFVNLAEEHGFELEDLEIGYINDEYDKVLETEGCYHSNLSDVPHKHIRNRHTV